MKIKSNDNFGQPYQYFILYGYTVVSKNMELGRESGDSVIYVNGNVKSIFINQNYTTKYS